MLLITLNRIVSLIAVIKITVISIKPSGGRQDDKEENVKIVIRFFAILFLYIVLVFPLRARSVAFSPIATEQEKKASEGIMVKGDIICLFQSGTADVRKTIFVNDILPVYREAKTHELVEVGKIKVIAYVGEDYIKAEVIEGELKSGDIAKKGEAAVLIISSEKKCE